MSARREDPHARAQRVVIAKRIRERMQALNLNEGAVATEIRASLSALRAWMREQSPSLPNVVVGIRLAKVLKVDPAVFYELPLTTVTLASKKDRVAK